MSPKEIFIRIRTLLDKGGVDQAAREFENLGSAAKKTQAEVNRPAPGGASGGFFGKLKGELDETTAKAKETETATTAVRASVEKIDKTSGEASKRARELGSSLGGAAQTASGLAAASKGGQIGLLGLATAIQGAITSVTAASGPVGIFIASLGILAGAAFALKDKLLPAKKGLDDTAKSADKAGKAFLGAKEGAQSFSEVSLDPLKVGLDQANEAAALLERSLVAAHEAQTALARSRLEAQIAITRVDPDLSEAQRADRVAGLQGAQRELEAKTPGDRAAIAEQVAAQRVEDQQRQLDELRRLNENAQQFRNQLPKPAFDDSQRELFEAEQRKLRAERAAKVVEQFAPEASPDQRDAAGQRINEIDARLDAIARSLNPDSLVDYDRAAKIATETARRVAEAEEELARRSSRLAEARKRLADQAALEESLSEDRETIDRAEQFGRDREARQQRRRGPVQDRATDAGESAARRAGELAGTRSVQADPALAQLVENLRIAGETAAAAPTEQNTQALLDAANALAKAAPAGSQIAEDLIRAASVVAEIVGQFQGTSAPIKRRAKGGNFNAGDRVLLGEEGAELVEFDRPGNVFNATQTRGMRAARPATPPNPPGSGYSNREWKQFYQSNPEAAQKFSEEKRAERTAGDSFDPNERMGDKSARERREMRDSSEAQRQAQRASSAAQHQAQRDASAAARVSPETGQPAAAVSAPSSETASAGTEQAARATDSAQADRLLAAQSRAENRAMQLALRQMSSDIGSGMARVEAAINRNTRYLENLGRADPV